MNEGVSDRVARLVKQLGHKEFAKRESALDALRKAATADDAEVRQRAAKVLTAITARMRAAAAKRELEKLQSTWYAVLMNHQGTVAIVDPWLNA